MAKVYRNRKERIENAAKMKKGNCLEVYQIMEAGSVPPDSIVMVKIAGTEQACRDLSDVEAVIIEQDVTGEFIAMRRCGDSISRVIQTVCSFVSNPKGDIKAKEVIK